MGKIKLPGAPTDIACEPVWQGKTAMQLFLTFSEYVESVQALSNETFDLGRALAPFGLRTAEVKSGDLLFGHVLDALAEEFRGNDRIDCLDIATSAAELGCQASELFLETGPLKIASHFGADSFGASDTDQ